MSTAPPTVSRTGKPTPLVQPADEHVDDELLSVLREQAVSFTRHRFGHVEA